MRPWLNLGRTSFLYSFSKYNYITARTGVNPPLLGASVLRAFLFWRLPWGQGWAQFGIIECCCFLWCNETSKPNYEESNFCLSQRKIVTNCGSHVLARENILSPLLLVMRKANLLCAAFAAVGKLPPSSSIIALTDVFRRCCDSKAWRTIGHFAN